MGEIYATAELVISSIASEDISIGLALKTNHVTGVPIVQAICRALSMEDSRDLYSFAPRMVVLLRALLHTTGFDQTHRILDPKFQQPFKKKEEAINWFSRRLGCKNENYLLYFFSQHDTWQETPRIDDQMEQNLQIGRFFETEDGYLGLGSSSLALGDEICFIRNCNIPVILRRKDDHCVYIGPCWIVGLETENELKSLYEKGRVKKRRARRRQVGHQPRVRARIHAPSAAPRGNSSLPTDERLRVVMRSMRAVATLRGGTAVKVRGVFRVPRRLTPIPVGQVALVTTLVPQGGLEGPNVGAVPAQEVAGEVDRVGRVDVRRDKTVVPGPHAWGLL